MKQTEWGVAACQRCFLFLIPHHTFKCIMRTASSTSCWPRRSQRPMRLGYLPLLPANPTATSWPKQLNVHVTTPRLSWSLSTFGLSALKVLKKSFKNSSLLTSQTIQIHKTSKGTTTVLLWQNKCNFLYLFIVQSKHPIMFGCARNVSALCAICVHELKQLITESNIFNLCIVSLSMFSSG